MGQEDRSPILDDLLRFKPEGLTPNAWAVLAGVSRTVWADMRRHGNPSRRTLEKLLTAAGSSLAEFEALRIGTAPPPSSVAGPALSDRSAGAWRPAQLATLPVLATATAGQWGDPAMEVELTEVRTDEVVDRVGRPASLANDGTAYAITIPGESMWPRFRRGRRVAVSATAPAAVGDDVVVKLKSGDGTPTAVLIKELVGNSANGVSLRQFNPDVTIHVPSSQISSIEKVVGELI